MARRRLNLDETTDEVVTETKSEPIVEEKPEKKVKSTKILEEKPKEEKFTVAVEGYLRVRKGPGLEYEVENQLPNGIEVTVTEINGEWAKIGPNLWVMKQFLK